MVGNIEDRVMSIAMLAALAVAGWFGYKYLLNGGSTNQPSGVCDQYTGLPRALCDLGVFATGYQDPVAIESGPVLDSHGCYVGIQNWCASKKKCLDKALYCDSGTCDPGYEFSSLYGKCLWAGGYVPTPVVVPEQRTKWCLDGNYVYPTQDCAPYNPPVQTTISCVCGSEVMTFPLDGRTCGEHCDDVSGQIGNNCAAVLWQCPYGWTDQGPVPGGRCCHP